VLCTPLRSLGVHSTPYVDNSRTVITTEDAWVAWRLHFMINPSNLILPILIAAVFLVSLGLFQANGLWSNRGA